MIRRGAPWRELVVEDENGCLVWQGQITATGYGMRSSRLAHRVVWMEERGPIPEGLTLDHLCRNPPCVNPDHLEPVTNRENLRRGEGFPGVNVRKTHCPRGHEYTPENTYIQQQQYGPSRSCLACRRAYDRIYNPTRPKR